MEKIPLLVHIVFYPESENARELARSIHRALNEDSAVPGLRIPTVFCAEDGKMAPPVSQNLDQAERSFVVTLADDYLNAEESWCSFVGDLLEGCRKTNHRFLPIQLTENAWPLDDRLDTISFVRAYGGQKEENARLVVRRIVIELCCYLHGDNMGGHAPTKMFISHSKMDMEEGPKVVDSLNKYLDQAQPIKTWVDTGDIPGGSAFAKEIIRGVRDSSLLCVLTNSYASRHWCRREILLAKEHQRPIVVVNALMKNEIRSFPYLGNLPVLRWNDNPEAAVDLLLKETLRTLHVKLVLDRWQVKGDILLTRPPELLTIAGMLEKTTVLYPDPPLGAEEVEALTKTNIKVTTPLERIANEKNLSGKKIALSMSESTDISRFGFDSVHLEAYMLELSRYLLVKGATLVYGGHLGSDGYTAKLTELVLNHNNLSGIDPVERIENFCGWPIPFDSRLKSRFKATARLRRIPRPDDIDEKFHPDLKADPEFFPGDRSPEHRYAWARGMTAMRMAETDEVCARIVLGGTFGPTNKIQADGSVAESWYAGRIPGVLEEVLLSVIAEQPVFLVGTFGGVASLVIDILEGRDRHEMNWEYQKRAPYAPQMRELYRQCGDEWLDYPKMTKLLKDKGISRINPLLTEADHRELFVTRDVVRMVQLIVKGLDKL